MRLLLATVKSIVSPILMPYRVLLFVIAIFHYLAFIRRL
ncbi:hypothetical protein A464_4411 [Salmonella bongori N268-08]|uniref:Uncharacterized protein n=1 Tax=Salmonella bongori N268-08 TaxID=1197719 RepID=S5N3I3_SALBN|nr:hypothetical protein A464_4411 [Salmonella bongori N268-08]